MSRPPSGHSGVSLIELVIATALSSLAFIALVGLAGVAARQQLGAQRSQTAQMNAALAFKAIEREISSATYLLLPIASGAGAVLAGCANAAAAPGGGPPAPIDAAQPMRFFAFCAAGATLYLHSLPGCPAAYTCATAAASSFGDAARPVSASFARPFAYSALVDVTLTASSAGFSAVRSGSFTVAAAAGRNQ